MNSAGLALMSGLTLALLTPVAFAATPPTPPPAADSFAANGQIAAQLEAKLDDVLMSNEIDQFSFAIYQQGKNYGENGTAYVSSNPKQEFVDRHIAAHCSPGVTAEKDGFGCRGAEGASPEDVKYFEFGDIKFSVLLEPDAYTNGTAIMAQSLIRNLTNPFPDSKMRDYVSKGSLADDSKARDAYAEYLSKLALIGVAAYSMNEMFGMRVPGKDVGITDPATVAAGTIMSAMQSEASKRFLKPDFETFLNDPTTDQTAVLKEMARMQAFSMWMQYMSYRQAERVEALVAAGLAASVNASMEAKKMLSAGR